MTDTIIAQSTPPTIRAAMIRISGPLCEEIAKNALALPSPTPRVSYLRNYRSLDYETILDQVIVVLYPIGKSFTGKQPWKFRVMATPSSYGK